MTALRFTPDTTDLSRKIRWETISQQCDESQPVGWYVVEEGGPDGKGFDVPRKSLEALKAMGR